MKLSEDHALYLVITEEYGKDRSVLEIAEAAIAGGVDIIQMREKNKPQEELIRFGKRVARLCNDKGVLFIINDDPFIAKAAGADGLHLGQEDIERYPLKEARAIVGSDKIIGISTHSMEQFTRANGEDFDYIAFGPLFETKTKGYCIGAQEVGEVARITKKPVFFIGGINMSNINDVIKRGAKRIALARGISEAEDITLKTEEFKSILTNKKNDRIAISINGKREVLERPESLADLVRGKGLVPEHVVVEHNLRIVPRGEWPGITVRENDTIEIISFVGGG